MGYVEGDDMMTDEEFAKDVADMQKDGDPEFSHGMTDDMVVSFLRDIGYPKTADALEEASGSWWYA